MLSGIGNKIKLKNFSTTVSAEKNSGDGFVRINVWSDVRWQRVVVHERWWNEWVVLGYKCFL